MSINKSIVNIIVSYSLGQVFNQSTNNKFYNQLIALIISVPKIMYVPNILWFQLLICKNVWCFLFVI